MKDEVRITVIATGFERSGGAGRPQQVAPREMKNERPVQNTVQNATPPRRDFQPRAFNTEDLDIPTFLRNRSTSDRLK
jgi:cell division protein FtsZ